MKIVIDENISFGKEAFSTIGNVFTVSGRNITNDFLKDTDALIVRSITNVNESLLENTKVKFVGTATIGFDHIDTTYLSEKGIEFTSAAGCNSHAVKEYVLNAVFNRCVKHNISLEGKSIGVIGTGNIGSKVAEISDALGLRVVRNDPPLQRRLKSSEFSSLEKALQCDIITFHVPLNKGGIDNTVHLLNEKNLYLVQPGAILINTSRGPVVNNLALKKRLKERKDLHVILDVWENEPNLDLELLSLVEIGTAHIAGYSLEGKVNGTTMIYEKLCKFLNKPAAWSPKLPAVSNSIIEFDRKANKEKLLSGIFSKSYNIMDDDALMRKLRNQGAVDVGKYFDGLRKTYNHRRELNNYKINGSGLEENYRNLFELLRLKTA
ncbi:MAG: 4-phosphoerythronate dehydrogenase [Melioribacteraceae bacterium]|nr:4-phosphoerythronate dehydrogenase [Melioribacteraceae bacterium]